jgi:anti-sigma regulatory factor (Ser/Thr protein kinase)
MPACSPAATATACQDWPLETRLELGPFPSALPCARIHARLVLLEWTLSHLADDAELIVSELTTNAIQATGHPIALFLRFDQHVLIIGVWDTQREALRPEPHAIDAESGRGLELVSILSDRWGVRYPETGGKVVWARLPVDAGMR